MAVDLSIEVFSVDLFRHLWLDIGLKAFVAPRLKNYDAVTNSIVCNATMRQAVLFRRMFFSDLLWRDIYFDYEIFSKSSADFFLFHQNCMINILPRCQLNIFDKLFMACVVVLEIAFLCDTRDNNMYVYYGPLCWAMYFDTECKEEFYDKGGWSELELYARSYKASVLNIDVSKDFVNPRHAFHEAISVEYSPDLIYRVFKEKIIESKAHCTQCSPLFHAISFLCGMSDEVDGFQLNEGYLQIILRMLSKEELMEKEKKYFQNTKFKDISELANIAEMHLNTEISMKVELLKDKTTSYKEIYNHLDEFQLQTSYDLLDRLFIAQNLDDANDKCMFCGQNVEDLPKSLKSITDYRVERIKSMINDTVTDSKQKGEESEKVSFEACENENDATNDALELFFSLGVQPLTSKILENLSNRRISKDDKDDVVVKEQSQKIPKNNMKKKDPKKRLLKCQEIKKFKTYHSFCDFYLVTYGDFF